MMLLKFGQKEHLELLKNGVFHFRQLDNFIKDSSNFRGDPLEGKLSYPKATPFIINGHDFSQYAPKITMSYVGVEDTLCFSTSILNTTNCHVVHDDIYTPNSDYINAMQQFGDYFLILPPYTVSMALNDKLKNHGCSFRSSSVFYCIKSDFDAIRNHFISKKGYVDECDMHCFTKDLSYSYQNEYRYIINDICKEFLLGPNGGVNLKTNFFNEFPVLEVSSLRTLQVSRKILE